MSEATRQDGEVAPVLPAGETRTGLVWRSVCGGVALIWGVAEVHLALLLVHGAILVERYSRGLSRAESLHLLLWAGISCLAGVLLLVAGVALLRGVRRAGRRCHLALAGHLLTVVAAGILAWGLGVDRGERITAVTLMALASLPALALVLLLLHPRTGGLLDSRDGRLRPVPYLLWGSTVTLILAIGAVLLLALVSAVAVQELLERNVTFPASFRQVSSEELVFTATALLGLACHAGLVTAALGQLGRRAWGLTLGLWCSVAWVVGLLAFVGWLFHQDGRGMLLQAVGLLALMTGGTLACWSPLVAGARLRRSLLGQMRPGQALQLGLLDLLVPEDPASRGAREARPERTSLHEELARDARRASSARLGAQKGRAFGNAVLLGTSLALLDLLMIYLLDQVGLHGHRGFELAFLPFPAAGLLLLAAGSILNWGGTYHGMTMLRVGGLVGLLGSLVGLQLAPGVVGLGIPSLAFAVVLLLVLLPVSRKALAPGYHPYLARGRQLQPCPARLWWSALVLVIGAPTLVACLGIAALVLGDLVGNYRFNYTLFLAFLGIQAAGWVGLLLRASRMLLAGSAVSVEKACARMRMVCLLQAGLGVPLVVIMWLRSRQWQISELVMPALFLLGLVLAVGVASVVASRQARRRPGGRTA